MLKSLRYFSVLLLVAALMANPIAASAAEMSANVATDGFIIGDLLLCRPLGAAATVLGSVIFVVSLPFSVLGDNTGQVADILVVEPAKFTFGRPLGQFK